ncbi:MAG: hypothetical protein B7Z66_13590 [Chromatiales bacterium 21-64-14]|nr:MAG: hypothetical protein B7Z66_13590 [Chromatiales bacterium 21-64-14]HQU17022.1 class II fructose-bisphosphate aldolase [Gammaproteobacteria bacterium]
MPLVHMRDLLDHAYRHNYAVGAFDVSGLECLEGVMVAAERCRAPVILNLAYPQFEDFDVELLMPAMESAACRAVVPVAIQLDHGLDVEVAAHAINRGCNGVMVDASDRELGENIGITREVVSMAHGCGVPVEGKLGYNSAPIRAGSPGEPQNPKDVVYTAVAEARVYVERTGVDFLAVSIGIQTGRSRAKLRPNWQRLKQLNEALQIPLVVHGGAGLTDDQFRRLIANGVAKIRFESLFTDAAGDRLRVGAKKAARNDYHGIMREIRRAVEQEVERYLRLWGAAGRAAEVLEQCRGWQPVEYAVFHSRDGLSEPEVAAVVEEGRRAFSAIPGVREVRTGGLLQSEDRFGWLLSFCDPVLIDGYREHPAYVSFARPRADRLCNASSIASGANPFRARPAPAAQEVVSGAWSRRR